MGKQRKNHPDYKAIVNKAGRISWVPKQKPTIWELASVYPTANFDSHIINMPEWEEWNISSLSNWIGDIKPNITFSDPLKRNNQPEFDFSKLHEFNHEISLMKENTWDSFGCTIFWNPNTEQFLTFEPWYDTTFTWIDHISDSDPPIIYLSDSWEEALTCGLTEEGRSLLISKFQ